MTKLHDKRSARIAALRIATQLLWKEYGAPTLTIDTVDVDATREAIMDLHDDLCRKLARFKIPARRSGQRGWWRMTTTNATTPDPILSAFFRQNPDAYNDFLNSIHKIDKRSVNQERECKIHLWRLAGEIANTRTTGLSHQQLYEHIKKVMNVG